MDDQYCSIVRDLTNRVEPPATMSPAYATVSLHHSRIISRNAITVALFYGEVTIGFADVKDTDPSNSSTLLHLLSFGPWKFRISFIYISFNLLTPEFVLLSNDA
jgi:hypothetical protein